MLIHYFLSEAMHTIASGRQYEDMNLVLLRCCLTAVRNGGETLFLVLNGCASLLDILIDSLTILVLQLLR